ncbi:hypothetical protein [Photobacterium carnosum]|uniref:KAP NTPase domain-containing protein n=1 Tax=Photobacterium carnosum TaxID=2023717 RepID=A0A2N4UM59_9GAMM|nr:hypothetical protein [Photobacterium carnosum]PLC56100.1 hypothetical protein CIK00_20165 [Photobacterium carnosum]
MELNKFIKRQPNFELQPIVKLEDIINLEADLCGFVITAEIEEQIRKLFYTYLLPEQNPRLFSDNLNTAVLVSGDFGMGKSHFLKAIAAVLENSPINNGDNSVYPLDIICSKITDPVLKSDICLAAENKTKVITLNLDSIISEHGTLTEAIFYSFNKSMSLYNYSANVIAIMESQLSEHRKLEPFKTAFKNESGENWCDVADTYDFYRDELLKSLSITVQKEVSVCDNWFENIESTQINVDFLTRWIEGYLSLFFRDSNSRYDKIVFVVDHLFDAIDSDKNKCQEFVSLLDAIKDKFHGRVWFICSALIESSKYNNEKAVRNTNVLKGLFKTKLSISSQSIQNIVESRLLNKTTLAEDYLSSVYDKYHQELIPKYYQALPFISPRDFTKQRFIDSYPLIPCYLSLLQIINYHLYRNQKSHTPVSLTPRVLISAVNNMLSNLVEIEVERTLCLSDLVGVFADVLKPQFSKAIFCDQGTDLEKRIICTLFLVQDLPGINLSAENVAILVLDRLDVDFEEYITLVSRSLISLVKQGIILNNNQEYSLANF